ncbi:hypothetical protein FKM82_027182 [Ascaphus truei]
MVTVSLQCLIAPLTLLLLLQRLTAAIALCGVRQGVATNRPGIRDVPCFSTGDLISGSVKMIKPPVLKKGYS